MEPRAVIIRAFGEKEQQPNVTTNLLDAQGLLEEATIKTIIKNINPQSPAGPSVLGYSHLQDALCNELDEDLAAFTKHVFSKSVLPHVF